MSSWAGRKEGAVGWREEVMGWRLWVWKRVGRWGIQLLEGEWGLVVVVGWLVEGEGERGGEGRRWSRCVCIWKGGFLIFISSRKLVPEEGRDESIVQTKEREEKKNILLHPNPPIFLLEPVHERRYSIESGRAEVGGGFDGFLGRHVVFGPLDVAAGFCARGERFDLAFVLSYLFGVGMYVLQVRYFT